MQEEIILLQIDLSERLKMDYARIKKAEELLENLDLFHVNPDTVHLPYFFATDGPTKFDQFKCNHLSLIELIRDEQPEKVSELNGLTALTLAFYKTLEPVINRFETASNAYLNTFRGAVNLLAARYVTQTETIEEMSKDKYEMSLGERISAYLFNRSFTKKATIQTLDVNSSWVGDVNILGALTKSYNQISDCYASAKALVSLYNSLDKYHFEIQDLIGSSHQELTYFDASPMLSLARIVIRNKFAVERNYKDFLKIE